MASTSLVAGLAAGLTACLADGLTPGSVADLTGGLTIEIIMLDLAGAVAYIVFILLVYNLSNNHS